ncbi:MAG TPA: flagellar basal body-associated FliL family protein [Phycisphaerales bacterium]|nr:flagellar basal body-associated FliL family protein [Phycisphaerales bacterium]
MADKKTDKKDVEKQEDSKAKKSDGKGLVSRFLPLIIMAVVVVFCAGAGFGLSRLLAGPDTAQTAEPAQEDEPTQAEDLKADVDSAAETQKSWYYPLEPVVANLDEPGVTRYVRATLMLEISPEVDQKKGIAFIEEKKPLLTNWLTIYLAGLGLEDIRGNRNLKRIQLQILDAFNERLFPDAKPGVKKILFKEFAIQ